MTEKTIPRDANNNPIQTLELGAAVAKITVTGTTARATLPTGCGAGDVVRLACNTDCYFVFGTSAIDATASHSLFTTGVEIIQVPKAATHIAAIQVDTAGVMTITEVH